MDTKQLTAQEALDYSKELWYYLSQTGKDKQDWPGWKVYGEMLNHCPLCEYAIQHSKDITIAADHSTCRQFCPLRKYYDRHCLGTAYGNWANADSSSDKKDTAALFLKELEAITITEEKDIKEQYPINVTTECEVSAHILGCGEMAVSIHHKDHWVGNLYLNGFELYDKDYEVKEFGTTHLGGQWFQVFKKQQHTDC